jgi:hypothetical protein
MTKEQAQTLAELFPSLKTKGIPSRYSAVDQIGFRFDPDLSGGDFWRLAACIPDKAPYLLGQGDLKSPFGQAIVEKMLELIAEREGWGLFEGINYSENGQAKHHCFVRRFKNQRWVLDYEPKLGSTRLEARTAAMIAAKQGQP